MKELPVAFWWHHPLRDRMTEDLVAATLDTQTRFGFDLVKVSPPGTYQTMDLGLVDAWCGVRRGYGAIAHRPVRTPDDWRRIADITQPGPAIERAVAALADIRARVDPAVPVLQTVFSPVAQAAQLIGDQRFQAALQHQPDLIHQALAALTARTIETLRQIRATGANGVFYAIQQSRQRCFTAPAYQALFERYDQPCVTALADFALNLIHVHGEGIHLPFTALPASCWVHWELIEGNPSIAEIRQRLPNRLAIGLPSAVIQQQAEAGTVPAYVASITAELDGRQAILTPGCTLPRDLPWAAVTAWIPAPRRPSIGAPAMKPIAKALHRPIGPLVEAAWKDIFGTETSIDVDLPGQPTAERRGLILLLRLEQDLARALPLDLLAGRVDAAEVTRRIEGLPEAMPDQIAAWPLLHVLTEPDAPPETMIGLARGLYGQAQMRLVDYAAADLTRSGDFQPPRVLAALMVQVTSEAPGRPVRLLGLGISAGLTVSLAEYLTARGTPLAFVGLIPNHMALFLPDRPWHRLRRLARAAWMGWGRLADRWGRPGLLARPIAWAGPVNGLRLQGAILNDRIRRRIAGFDGAGYHGVVTAIALPPVPDPFLPPYLAEAAAGLSAALAGHGETSAPVGHETAGHRDPRVRSDRVAKPARS